VYYYVYIYFISKIAFAYYSYCVHYMTIPFWESQMNFFVLRATKNIHIPHHMLMG